MLETSSPRTWQLAVSLHSNACDSRRLLARLYSALREVPRHKSLNTGCGVTQITELSEYRLVVYIFEAATMKFMFDWAYNTQVHHHPIVLSPDIAI